MDVAMVFFNESKAYKLGGTSSLGILGAAHGIAPTLYAVHAAGERRKDGYLCMNRDHF